MIILHLFIYFIYLLLLLLFLFSLLLLFLLVNCTIQSCNHCTYPVFAKSNT